MYTVRYNPDTQDVCAVALESFLTDAFYNRRCYGSFYNVCQQDPKRKDPKKDLEACVDRNYMLLRHGAEFVGVELPDSFYAKSTAYPGSDYESSSDSEEEEEEEDEEEEEEDEEEEGEVEEDEKDHVDEEIKEEKINEVEEVEEEKEGQDGNEMKERDGGKGREIEKGEEQEEKGLKKNANMG